MNHRHRRRIPGQWLRADLQQDHRRKLQTKKRHTHIDTSSTQNTRQTEPEKNSTHHIINETVNIQNNERVLQKKKATSHIESKAHQNTNANDFTH